MQIRDPHKCDLKFWKPLVIKMGDDFYKSSDIIQRFNFLANKDVA